MNLSRRGQQTADRYMIHQRITSFQATKLGKSDGLEHTLCYGIEARLFRLTNGARWNLTIEEASRGELARGDQ